MTGYSQDRRCIVLQHTLSKDETRHDCSETITPAREKNLLTTAALSVRVFSF